MSSIPERFLPVEPVIRQILREKHPRVNTHPGSAMHDVFVLPAALIYQRFRDTARILQRNQSLKNYNTMLPEELDRLASNFLLSRRKGTPASGVQRLYFNDVQAVNIETSAVFTDTLGGSYKPITAVRLTATQVAASYVSDTDEYYVDVPITSTGVGSAYKVGPGQINAVTGVLGAVRTENLAGFSGGEDEESNSELYTRIRSALTNRELVKKDGIIATIQDAFPAVRSVLVQGYGDPKQLRDVLSVSAALNELIPTSYCQKVNLPLDENGEVVWLNTSGQEINYPIGGFVGAIYDLAEKDFFSLIVSMDGVTTIRVPVQEGFSVRLLSPEDVDSVNNDFVVTRVEEVPVTANGTPVKILRLDRQFVDTAPVGNVLDKTPYTIHGAIYTDNFHVGGKIDVYVDTTSETTRQVVVNSVLPAAPGSDVGEIPLTATAEDDLGNSIFENNVGFIAPVISITKVEQLDFVNDNEVVRELIPDTHYAVVRAEVRNKYTQIDNDMLVVRGTEQLIDPETNEILEEESPLFIGQRLRITYITNPDIETIQSFVDTSSQRDVTKDILIKPPTLVNVEVLLTYTGTPEEESVRETIQNYVNQLGFDTPLTSSDLITVLTHLGVTKVNLPMQLIARYDLGNGRISTIQSEDALVPGLSELFRAQNLIGVLKV